MGVTSVRLRLRFGASVTGLLSVLASRIAAGSLVHVRRDWSSVHFEYRHRHRHSYRYRPQAGGWRLEVGGWRGKRPLAMGYGLQAAGYRRQEKDHGEVERSS